MLFCLFAEMYRCSICDSANATLSASLKHAALHKNISYFQVKCPFQSCFKTFSKIGTMIYSHINREHRQIRRAEQENQVVVNVQPCSLVCPVDSCIQLCKDYKSLVAHMKVHILQGTAVRCPFQTCKRMYKNKSSFSSHLCRCHGKSACVPADMAFQMTQRNQVHHRHYG